MSILLCGLVFLCLTHSFSAGEQHSLSTDDVTPGEHVTHPLIQRIVSDTATLGERVAKPLIRRVVSNTAALSQAEASDPSRGETVKADVDLLIAIPSHAQYDVESRNGIRSSWQNYLDPSGRCVSCDSDRIVKILFVIGETDQRHSVPDIDFPDMLVLPAYRYDSYDQLSRKTRLMIRHITEHFRFKVLMKADTDTWVYLDRLLLFMDQHNVFKRQSGVYGGLFNSHIVPRKDGKWKDLTFQALTGQQEFPTYAQGSGYMLSWDLCEQIARNSGSLVDLANEDVSVGFWLSSVPHTKVDLAFAPWPEPRGGCKVLLEHHMTHAMMRERWQSLLPSGFQENCTVTWLDKLSQMADTWYANLLVKLNEEAIAPSKHDVSSNM